MALNQINIDSLHIQLPATAILYFNTELVGGAITRSVHNRLNCITVNFDKSKHGIYMVLNFIIFPVKL